MSDRIATVLNVLASADRLGDGPLGRTSIVKITYLCEMLRPSYALWTRSFDFVSYHYGPYSDDIFNCLDFLLFHRLADVQQYSRHGGVIHARYRVTEHGAHVVSQLRGRETGHCLTQLTEDVIWALQGLGIRTAKELCALVYAEPFFARALRDAESDDNAASAAALLPADHPSHPSFRLQAILRSWVAPPIRDGGSDTSSGARRLVRSYLNYLAMHMHKTSSEVSL